mgnify:CR=1 FL=1
MGACMPYGNRVCGVCVRVCVLTVSMVASSSVGSAQSTSPSTTARMGCVDPRPPSFCGHAQLCELRQTRLEVRGCTMAR